MSHSSPDTDLQVSALQVAISSRLYDCGVALQESLVAGVSVERMREPIVAFATAAREEGFPPERALALFKDTLNRVSAMRHRDIDERTQLVSALVSMSIEAYYAGST